MPGDKGFSSRSSGGSQGVQVRPRFLRVDVVLRDRGDASEVVGARVNERPPACPPSVSPCQACTASARLRAQQVRFCVTASATALCLLSVKHKLM